MLSYTVCYKKINNTVVKFVVFTQQPISQDLCVNIAPIRSKIFLCIRKSIKFVKVSFQVHIKLYMLLLNVKIIETSKTNLLNQEKKLREIV